MRLVVLAGSGSPWSYSAIEAIAATGIEVVVVHVPPGRGQAYIDPKNPAWAARKDRLRSIVAELHAPEIGSGLLRYVRLGRWLKAYLRRHPGAGVLSLYGGGLALAGALSGAKRFAIYLVGSDVTALSVVESVVSDWVVRRAHPVFANGDSLAEAAGRRHPGLKVTSLLLGVDTARFQPGAPAAEPVRFLCARGFHPVYNNEQILRALAELGEGEMDWEMVFTAGGDQLPSSIAWADENLPPEVRRRVRFLGGIGQDELLIELQNSHVFVSMSRSDGASTSLLEALSCGLFPILSDIPANRPWVADGELIPLDQPSELAQAMTRALRSRPFGPEVREARRQKIVQVADSTINMSRLVDQLREAWKV